MSLNKFQVPTQLQGKDTIFIELIRLILCEKGTFESHPDMGVGLVSRYRNADVDKMSDLQSDISDQISRYLPSLQGSNIEVKTSVTVDKQINIQISVDDTLYAFTTDTTNNTIKLSDLK